MNSGLRLGAQIFTGPVWSANLIIAKDEEEGRPIKHNDPPYLSSRACLYPAGNGLLVFFPAIKIPRHKNNMAKSFEIWVPNRGKFEARLLLHVWDHIWNSVEGRTVDSDSALILRDFDPDFRQCTALLVALQGKVIDGSKCLLKAHSLLTMYVSQSATAVSYETIGQRGNHHRHEDWVKGEFITSTWWLLS